MGERRKRGEDVLIVPTTIPCLIGYFANIPARTRCCCPPFAYFYPSKIPPFVLTEVEFCAIPLRIPPFYKKAKRGILSGPHANKKVDGGPYNWALIRRDRRSSELGSWGRRCLGLTTHTWFISKFTGSIVSGFNNVRSMSNNCTLVFKLALNWYNSSLRYVQYVLA